MATMAMATVTKRAMATATRAGDKEGDGKSGKSDDDSYKEGNGIGGKGDGDVDEEGKGNG
jgi:hypothetical protein